MKPDLYDRIAYVIIAIAALLLVLDVLSALHG